MEVKTIIGIRGKKVLVVDNYKFCYGNILSNGLCRWRCINKTVNCPAKVYTKLGQDDPDHIDVVNCDLAHNHLPPKQANEQYSQNTEKIGEQIFGEFSNRQQDLTHVPSNKRKRKSSKDAPKRKLSKVKQQLETTIKDIAVVDEDIQDEVPEENRPYDPLSSELDFESIETHPELVAVDMKENESFYRENLDAVDRMFLDFSRRFKGFKRERQLTLKRKLYRLMIETDLEDMEAKYADV